MLRRIIKHAKSENWFLVAVDFLVVVVGIFIALQVTEWDNLRKERVEHQVYIEAIRNEIAGQVTLFETNVLPWHQKISKSLLWLSRQNPDSLKETSDELKAEMIAFGLYHIGTWYPKMPVFEELIITGKVKNLRNSKLKNYFTRLRSRILEVKDKAEGLESMQSNRIDPYLIKAFPMLLLKEFVFRAEGLGPGSLNFSGAMYNEFITRVETQNLVFIKYAEMQLLEELYTQLLEVLGDMPTD